MVLKIEKVLESMHPYDFKEIVSYFCNASVSSLAITCFNCSDFNPKVLCDFNL
jgi:hypothetical protein